MPERLNSAIDDVHVSFSCYLSGIAAHRRERLRDGLARAASLEAWLLNEALVDPICRAWTATALTAVRDLQRLLQISGGAAGKRPPDFARWQFLWNVAVCLEDAGCPVKGHPQSVFHEIVELCFPDPNGNPRNFTAQTAPIARLLKALRASNPGARFHPSWAWSGSDDALDGFCVSIFQVQVPARTDAFVAVAIAPAPNEPAKFPTGRAVRPKQRRFRIPQPLSLIIGSDPD